MAESLGKTSVARTKRKKDIFLSHCGQDSKLFTTYLFDELRNRQQNVFLDVDSESLPKGERFPENIYEAVRGCKLVVFVLSEFFVKRKWPMIELVAAVREYNNKRSPLLLPLFYTLEVNRIDAEIVHPDNQKTWNEWSTSNTAPGDMKLGATECGEALKVITRHNGMSRDGQRDHDFIKKVADEICKKITPNIWGINDMVHHRQLSQEVRQWFGGGGETKLVGIWGGKDTGKTSLSSSLCHHLYAEHDGNVHYAELKIQCKSILLDVKDILRNLTGASPDLLETITNLPSAIQCFKNRIEQRRFFLAIDNIPRDEDCKRGLKDLLVAIMNIDRGQNYRKVLVTARDDDVLKQFLRECGCRTNQVKEVPKLKKKALCDILIMFATKSSKSWNTLNAVEKDAVNSLVDEMSSSAGQAKTIGVLISGSGDEIIKDPRQWKSVYAKFLNDDAKDELFFEIIHRVLGDAFQDQAKVQQVLLFLVDAALYENTMGLTLKATWRWLGIVHCVSEELIRKKFKEIKKLKLIDWKKEDEADDEEVADIRPVFDEWPRFDFFKFAKVQVRRDPSKWGWFYYDGRKPEHRKARPNTETEEWEKVEKVAVVRSDVKFVQEVVNLRRCRGVVALMMARCGEVEEVEVGCMGDLQVLEVEDCVKLERINGMEKGDKLVRLYLNCVPKWAAVDGEQLQLGHFKNLRSVRLRDTGMEEPPIITGCYHLRELYIEDNKKLKRLPEFDGGGGGSFRHLTNISFADNPLITTLPDLSPLAACLAELSLRSCSALANLNTVESLTSLQRINISGCTSLGFPPEELCVHEYPLHSV